MQETVNMIMSEPVPNHHLWYLKEEDIVLSSKPDTQFLSPRKPNAKQSAPRKGHMKFQRTGFPHSEVHLSFNKLLPRHQHENEMGMNAFFLPSLLVTSKLLNSCKKRKALCFWRIIHVHSYLQTSHPLLAIYSHKGEQCHKNMTFSNARWVLNSQHTHICKGKQLVAWGT